MLLDELPDLLYSNPHTLGTGWSLQGKVWVDVERGDCWERRTVETASLQENWKEWRTE